jgi:hypothetical protein
VLAELTLPSDSCGDSPRRLDGVSFVVGYLGPNEDYYNWNSGGEFLYAFTVITTIGYGVFVPITYEGRWFTIVYAMVGFCLVGFAMGRTSAWLEGGILAAYQTLFAARIEKRRLRKREERRRKRKERESLLCDTSEGMMRRCTSEGAEEEEDFIVRTLGDDDIAGCQGRVAGHVHDFVNEFLPPDPGKRDTRKEGGGETPVYRRCVDGSFLLREGNAEGLQEAGHGDKDAKKGAAPLPQPADVIRVSSPVLEGVREEVNAGQNGDKGKGTGAEKGTGKGKGKAGQVRNAEGKSNELVDGMLLDLFAPGSIPQSAAPSAPAPPPPPPPPPPPVLYADADGKGEVSGKRSGVAFEMKERQQREQDPVSLGQLRAELEGIGVEEEGADGGGGLDELAIMAVKKVEDGEQEQEQEQEEEDGEADEEEAAMLLIVYSVLTLAWLLVMAKDFMETEGSDTWMVGVYYAFVTTTTIGFGDLAPDLTKQRPVSYLIIVIGLLLMGQWLGAAGGFFFKCMGGVRSLFCSHDRHDDGRRRHVPVMITPMHAVASLVHSSAHAVSKVTESASNKLHADEEVHCCRTSALLHELAQSTVFFIVVLLIGSKIFTELEFPAAKEESTEWWARYDNLIDEFQSRQTASWTDGLTNATWADNNVTHLDAWDDGPTSAKAEDDVMQALALLNSMGTCSEPPKKEGDMDFHVMASVLYAFYIGSTIGYGDLNVRTVRGMGAVVAFACVAMWAFGWFADSICNVLQLGITAPAACIHDALRRLSGQCMHALKGGARAKQRNQRVENSEMLSHSTATKSTEAEADGRQAKWWKRGRTALTFAFTLLFTVIFAAMCEALEAADTGQGWGLFDSAWFIFISCTTIGFGDMYPNRGVARIGVTLLQLVGLCIGLALYAIATGELVGLFDSSVDEIEKDAVGLVGGAEAMALRKAGVEHEHVNDLEPVEGNGGAGANGLVEGAPGAKGMIQYREGI